MPRYLGMLPERQRRTERANEERVKRRYAPPEIVTEALPRPAHAIWVAVRG
jgi:hypothetical protein